MNAESFTGLCSRQFENTDITINEAVYGGVEQTRRKAFQMVKRGIRNIITVTSCIPGMSGDDLVPLQKELKSLRCRYVYYSY